VDERRPEKWGHEEKEIFRCGKKKIKSTEEEMGSIQRGTRGSGTGGTGGEMGGHT